MMRTYRCIRIYTHISGGYHKQEYFWIIYFRRVPNHYSLVVVNPILKQQLRVPGCRGLTSFRVDGCHTWSLTCFDLEVTQVVCLIWRLMMVRQDYHRQHRQLLHDSNHCTLWFCCTILVRRQKSKPFTMFLVVLFLITERPWFPS